MFMGGKEMIGYLLVDPAGYDLDEELEFWIQSVWNTIQKRNRVKKGNKRG